MIVKKSPTSKLKKKSASIRDLVNYILDVKEDSTDKVAYSGSRGFISGTDTGRREEMVALSNEAVRSKNSVNHYIISWREGEQPTYEQVEESVTIFLQELGLDGHQTIFGLHQDTDNTHLHICINRVNPDTLKCVEINKGFDIEAAHRAIAVIEHTHGWQREQNGRYQVDQDENLTLTKNNKKGPSQKIRDKEVRTGQRSAERIVIEDASEFIRGASSWKELHEKLAANGMTFQKKGSGALLIVGDVPIKASKAGKDCSMAALVKRLGEFQPGSVEPEKRVHEPLAKNYSPKWVNYKEEREIHYKNKKADYFSSKKNFDGQRKTLREKHQEGRNEIFGSRSWKGKRNQLNELRSVLAASQASELAKMKECQAQDRKMHSKRFKPFPIYEDWLKMHLGEQAGQEWRHRSSEPEFMVGSEFVESFVVDIRAYSGEPLNGDVYYFKRSEDANSMDRRSDFVDRGGAIEMQNKDDAAILAAIQLAIQKWPKGFKLTGSLEYQKKCIEVAAKNNLRLGDADLRVLVEKEKERLKNNAASPAIVSRYTSKTKIKSNINSRKTKASSGKPVFLEAGSGAYFVHLKHIVENKLHKNGVDLSRVDSMISLRLRATGHTQMQIQKMIEQGAPTIRDQEQKINWSEYARRTAKYAFSVAANRNIDRLNLCIEAWKLLEKSALPHKKAEQEFLDAPSERQLPIAPRRPTIRGPKL